MKKLMLYGLGLFLGVSACFEKAEPVPEQVVSVKTGTSFGMCAGYCITEVEISPQQLTMYRKAWRTQLPDRTCQRALSTQEWESLAKTVDFAAFAQLPETIGCPDCADGGKEWIEITQGEQVKRVTFEFGKEVPSISGLIAQTRQLRASLKNCEP
jgi:rubredoxin